MPPVFVLGCILVICFCFLNFGICRAGVYLEEFDCRLFKARPVCGVRCCDVFAQFPKAVFLDCIHVFVFVCCHAICTVLCGPIGNVVCARVDCVLHRLWVGWVGSVFAVSRSVCSVVALWFVLFALSACCVCNVCGVRCCAGMRAEFHGGGGFVLFAGV